MAEALVSLRAALEERNRLLTFASRLEDLNAEGSLSETDYSTGRADYDSRIIAATVRIQALKSALTKELEASEHEADMCRLRSEGVEAHHLAGELSDEAYRTEERRWNAHKRRTDERCLVLEIALAAESVEDLGEVGKTAQVDEVSAQPALTRPANPTRPEKRAAPFTVEDSRAPMGWTRLRISAVAAAIILLVSIRLAWITPTELLGKDLASEAGASVSFLAAMGGLLCGFAGIGVSFIRTPHTRGILQVAAGALAMVALAAAVFLGELPLHDTYFRQLVTLREGFFAYVVAAAGLAVLGFLQWRSYR